jgi:4-hydroxy-3-polyprenylbenzoate decarboxylase
VDAGVHTSILLSKAGRMVLATESALRVPSSPSKAAALFSDMTAAAPGQIEVFGLEDWLAPVASGSGAPEAMVVCPCTAGALSAIATGASNNLIERAADVCLKERRKLILVVREMPLSEIHLEHMLRLTRMGAVVMPASPGFYQQPQSVEDLVDFVVARVLDHLGVDQALMPRWGYGAGED